MSLHIVNSNSHCLVIFVLGLYDSLSVWGSLISFSNPVFLCPGDVMLPWYPLDQSRYANSLVVRVSRILYPWLFSLFSRPSLDKPYLFFLSFSLSSTDSVPSFLPLFLKHKLLADPISCLAPLNLRLCLKWNTSPSQNKSCLYSFRLLLIPVNGTKDLQDIHDWIWDLCYNGSSLTHYSQSFITSYFTT